jgi:hypothetical protein
MKGLMSTLNTSATKPESSALLGVKRSLAAVSLVSVAVSLAPGSLAQQARLDPIPVKNWAVPASSGRNAVGVSSSNSEPSGFVFVSITPCRLVDTRAGSPETGQFGAPSLVANQARTFVIPSSPCGVPVAAAYSLNLISITQAGQPVDWLAAWADNISWPGTTILNAVLGGIVDNAAIVSAGTDGGIQVLSTNATDLVIDMNGYFIQAPAIVGPAGPAGPTGATGPQGPAGATGPAGPIGPQGLQGLPGAAGPAGAAGAQGPPVNFRGPWSNSTPYVVGDAVSFTPSGGVLSSYIAVTASTGVEPDTDVSGSGGHWALLAQAGATGAQGPTGPAGPAGPTGAPGPIGAQGIAGPQGAQGLTGLPGATGAQGPAGPTGATGPAGPAGGSGSGGSPTGIPLIFSGHTTGTAAHQVYSPIGGLNSSGAIDTTTANPSQVAVVPASCKPSMSIWSYTGNAQTWGLFTTTPASGSTTWTIGTESLISCSTAAPVGSSCSVTGTTNLEAGTVLVLTNGSSGAPGTGGIVVGFSCN